ncbi:hypothetical protein ACPW90_003466 [Providencia rettgeri]|uniref:hypothetical protein n=1 Tax=Providencia rettgeri TaxID=587 RepID=UPI0013E97886|nr:hypothetical protein [Providencia rettgeri]
MMKNHTKSEKRPFGMVSSLIEWFGWWHDFKACLLVGMIMKFKLGLVVCRRYNL